MSKEKYKLIFTIFAVVADVIEMLDTLYGKKKPDKQCSNGFVMLLSTVVEFHMKVAISALKMYSIL